MPGETRKAALACSRRSFLAASAGSASALGALRASMPNVLLITADDMNWDSPGVYGGGPAGITPNIDRLASQGMRFAHAHVTIAVCQPSRSVLMTGRYPYRNGAEGFEPIRADVPTLQERLRAAGYLNGILAKTEHLTPPRKFCWDYFVPGNELGMGRSPSLYYRRTKEFLDRAKTQRRPFFLMANSQDPHRPFAGSAAERAWLRGNQLPFPRRFEPDEVSVPGFLSDLPDVRRELAQYLQSVHRCDQTVGEVLRALEESGLADRTLVVFVSDNGMAFPFAKTNCYLASTKTPWLVRWPGRVKPGAMDARHFISGIDFTPTVLDAAGLEPLDEVDGRSFAPLLSGFRQEQRDRVFTMFHETSAPQRYEMRCVQDRRFGYIFNAWSDGNTVFRNESQHGLTFAAMRAAGRTSPEIAGRVRFFEYRTTEELYDVQADANCLTNLIGREDYAPRVAQLRRVLLENMRRTGDPAAAELQKVLP